MTVFELLNYFEKKLKKAHIPLAHIDADILLGLAFKKNQSFILTHNLQIVHPKKITAAKKLLARRLKQEPIAYIRGWQMFYGKKFIVNKYTLIPRPETELCIEHILNTIPKNFKGLFLDIGTGSGALAVTLADLFNHSKIIATDNSSQALAIARKNAKLNNVSKRINFLYGDLLTPLKKSISRNKKPYILVANLPYVPTNVWKNAEYQVKRFEPRGAIDGGRDGLTLYKKLFKQIKKTSILPAELWAEIDQSHTRLFSSLVSTMFPKTCLTLFKDLQNYTRLARIVF